MRMYLRTPTPTGMCIPQPEGSAELLEWKGGPVRREEPKKISIANPSDKDWILQVHTPYQFSPSNPPPYQYSLITYPLHIIPINPLINPQPSSLIPPPSSLQHHPIYQPNLDGEHWRVPHEVKIPAKGSADLVVTYFPLTMCPVPPPVAPAAKPAAAKPGKAGKGAPAASPSPVEEAKAPDGQDALHHLPPHQGRLFVALPDGSARLFQLKGDASPNPALCILTQHQSINSPFFGHPFFVKPSSNP